MDNEAIASSIKEAIRGQFNPERIDGPEMADMIERCVKGMAKIESLHAYDFYRDKITFHASGSNIGSDRVQDDIMAPENKARRWFNPADNATEDEIFAAMKAEGFRAASGGEFMKQLSKESLNKYQDWYCLGYVRTDHPCHIQVQTSASGTTFLNLRDGLHMSEWRKTDMILAIEI